MKALARKLRKWLGPLPVPLPGAAGASAPAAPRPAGTPPPRPPPGRLAAACLPALPLPTLDSDHLPPLGRGARRALAAPPQALGAGLHLPGTRGAGHAPPRPPGLGFAVGAEKLPALFAARGCEITATDLPADDERRNPWAETGQWVGERDALNAAGLCDPTAFRERVEFRPVDMNHVPARSHRLRLHLVDLLLRALRLAPARPRLPRAADGLPRAGRRRGAHHRVQPLEQRCHAGRRPLRDLPAPRHGSGLRPARRCGATRSSRSTSIPATIGSTGSSTSRPTATGSPRRRRRSSTSGSTSGGHASTSIALVIRKAA